MTIPSRDTQAARQATISGLRELASFLQANPAIPIRHAGQTVLVFGQGDCDACQRADIDRIADLLGSPIEPAGPGGHYCTARNFGLIEYRAVHIPARCCCRCGSSAAAHAGSPATTQADPEVSR